jgi:hypothetical protein
MDISKSRQRQFLTLLNAEQVPAMARGGKLPTKHTNKALSRLQSRLDKMKAPFANVPPKTIRAIQRRYIRAVAGRPDESSIAITEHIGTCLRLAEDCRERGAQPRREWDYLVQTLFTLYQHYDPEITADNQAVAQEMGEQIIEQFN